jgi:hypothetical protein
MNHSILDNHSRHKYYNPSDEAHHGNLLQLGDKWN